MLITKVNTYNFKAIQFFLEKKYGLEWLLRIIPSSRIKASGSGCKVV